MTQAFQGSLLDLCGEAGPGPLGTTVQRTALAHGAWIDVRRGWISGADALFERLIDTVPWRAERRHMYDRVVNVPRLLCFYDEGEPLPDPALDEIKRELDEHYGPELGEPFRTAGLCLYRDGRDSVAWHGDTTGRSSTQDTMVAIVSLGAPRTLMLRPRGGGTSAPEGRQRGGNGQAGGAPAATGRRGRALRHDLGHGDLLVMGGSCQRTWEHSIPKTARTTGPRISVQFRPRDVR
jgi:alkylated DNA repair dioxygenase AlkB